MEWDVIDANAQRPRAFQKFRTLGRGLCGSSID